MPRKKKEEKALDESVAHASSNDSEGSRDDAKLVVTVLKTAEAEKLSPRGDGRLTYQVGRMDDTVLLRISGNASSGRFSKEWVPVDAIRQSLAQLPKDAHSFKGALALKTAWKGQSSCNSGFGAAILKAEGVFAADKDPKKKGMLQLSTPDALEAWEKTVLAMNVRKDAEKLPLHPPKPKPFFAKKDTSAAQSEEADSPESDEDTSEEQES